MKIHEILCKSILSPSKLPGCDYVINPYIGCAHGCVWCYSAGFIPRYTGHEGEQWGSFADVKINAPEVLLKDIKKFKDIEVGMSFITMDEKATRVFQPVTALPKERVEALRQIHTAGIKTYIHLGPILPYFTDFKEIFGATHKYIDSAMGETLNTRGENWLNLIKVLSKHYPQLLPEFKKSKFQNLDYLGQIGVDFEKAAERFKIPVSGVYTHA